MEHDIAYYINKSICKDCMYLCKGVGLGKDGKLYIICQYEDVRDSIITNCYHHKTELDELKLALNRHLTIEKVVEGLMHVYSRDGIKELIDLLQKKVGD